MEVSLKTKQLNKLFPFHVMVDEHLNVIGFGNSMPKLIQLTIGNSFFEYFIIKRPELIDKTFDGVLKLVNQLLIITHTHNTALTIRGQVELIEDVNYLMFIVSPWFSTVEELRGNNIGLKDFAIHDSSIDLLHSFKAQEVANNDAKDLFKKLQEQKSDLHRLSLIAKETFNSVVVTDSKGRIQWANKAYEILTGYTIEESLGKTPGSFLQGELTDPATVQYLRERIRAGFSFDCELLNYHKDGHHYWVRLSGQPILDRNGNVVQFFAFEEDITEKKIVQNKLDEQRHFYEDVLNNIPSDIAVFDKEHHYLFLNPIAIKNPELRKWMIGKRDEDYFAHTNKPMSIAKKRREHFDSIIASKKLTVWEEELTNKEGNKDYLIRNMYPVLDDDGEVKLVIGYGVNITDRKLVEQQLERKEKSYRDLFNYSQALICTHDLAGNLLTVNPALCKTIGYSDSEIIGKNLMDFIPKEDIEKFRPLYLDNILAEEKAGGVFRVVHKNGDVLFLLYQNYRVEEEGMQPYVIGFSQNITDRIKAENELRLAKQLTEESARAKEIFLANMSHEIRTPMHGIIGIADLLSRTKLSDEQENYLKLIIDSANNLVVIINDILDIEKIGSGKFEFETLDFKLADKLKTTLQSFQYKAEEKNIQLSLNCKFDAELIVTGDPYRLGQILNNLISNALKFTAKGKITINGSITENENAGLLLKCSISDTGIGISKDKLDVIFDPFVQASSDTTRKYGGTGLGLSICKNLVELQGGNISVESTIGEGTTFTFEIPYQKGTPISLQNNKEQAEAQASFVYNKILMAEDVEVNQFLARIILESKGWEVDIANNGVEAIEFLENNDYDMILMDVQMPEMDGITATMIIRQMENPKKASIPIVALTANALVGNEQEYFDIGMNACLTKPFTEEKLFLIINKVLNATID